MDIQSMDVRVAMIGTGLWGSLYADPEYSASFHVQVLKRKGHIFRGSTP